MDTNTICPYPWRHLSNVTNGSVRPCCHYQGEILDDNLEPFLLQKSPISKIYSSRHMNKIREDMRQGKKLEECDWCWEKEAQGLSSKRTEKLAILQNHRIKIDYDSDPELPVEVQIILNNSCNLKCRMCSPALSTEWMKEVNNYSDADKQFLPDRLIIDTKDYFSNKQVGSAGGLFIETIEEWGKFIQHIEIVGGEPFYSAAWTTVFDKLIKFGYSKSIIILITTNGTLFPEETFNKLRDNFKEVHLTLSIDGLGNIFEYIRSNAKWDIVEKNIEKIAKYHSETFRICFIYSYNWLNIIQFPTFFLYMKTKYPDLTVFLNQVNKPKYWALETAPPIFKQQIAYTLTYYLDNYSEDWVSTVQQNMVKELKAIRDILLEDKTTILQNTKYYRIIFKIEKYREGSIIDVAQEIEDKYIINCPSEHTRYSIAKELRLIHSKLSRENLI